MKYDRIDIKSRFPKVTNNKTPWVVDRKTNCMNCKKFKSCKVAAKVNSGTRHKTYLVGFGTTERTLKNKSENVKLFYAIAKRCRHFNFHEKPDAQTKNNSTTPKDRRKTSPAKKAGVLDMQEISAE